MSLNKIFAANCGSLQFYTADASGLSQDAGRNTGNSDPETGVFFFMRDMFYDLVAFMVTVLSCHCSWLQS
jgi:hypothetical protein